ncbi:MAG: hypothetical protein KGR26_02970, partial [Cyanobacteria bacterium REEB65]|nr:hypothetical protein [Cyanobacteria bacterium REEB65]
ASLDDKTLLALSRQWGRVGQVAFRRFLATLPEIARRGLYRRARCHSIFEYAAKCSGATQEVVDAVFLVHKRIGGFAVLWELFAQGRYGLPVFRRISRHVTGDNAAWWAEVVSACTVKEIERILREQEAGAAGTTRGQLPLEHANHSPGLETPAGSLTASPREDTALESAAGQAPESCAQGVPELATSDLRCATGAAPEIPAASSSDSLLAERCNERLSDPRANRPSGLSPLAAAIADNLVEEYRRRGLTVSRQEIVEGALRFFALQGAVPEIPCTVNLSGAGKPAASCDGPEAARSVPRPLPQPRKVRLPRVLITLADVGVSFLRTIGGLIPLTSEECVRLDSGRPALVFSDLLAKAGRVGQTATGRTIPSMVKLAVSIRAGGTCEAQGCSSPIQEFEHLDPYSEHQAHRPDRIAGLCACCHRTRHNGLIANPDDPPGMWRALSVGATRPLRRVDRQVQACRQQAREAMLSAATKLHMG